MLLQKNDNSEAFAIHIVVHLSQQEVDYARSLSMANGSKPKEKQETIQHGIKLALWQHNHFQDNLNGFTEALDDLCKGLSKEKIAKTIIPFVEKLKKLDN